MSPIQPPPPSLARFPRRTLRAGSVLSRVHRAANAPEWYSGDGRGRFDLLDGRGTLYLGTDRFAAALEVFRGQTLIPEAEVAIRRISDLEVPAPLTLANVTSERARGFGLTGEIHSTPDYAITQQWAAALADTGFDGIHYHVRHDPSQRLTAVALFGPAGAQALLPVLSTNLLDDGGLLPELQRRFGLVVVPTP